MGAESKRPPSGFFWTEAQIVALVPRESTVEFYAILGCGDADTQTPERILVVDAPFRSRDYGPQMVMHIKHQRGTSDTVLLHHCDPSTVRARRRA